VTDHWWLRRMRRWSPREAHCRGVSVRATELGHGSSEMSNWRALSTNGRLSGTGFSSRASVSWKCPGTFIISDEAGRIVMLNAQTEKLSATPGKNCWPDCRVLVPERARSAHAAYRESYRIHPSCATWGPAGSSSRAPGRHGVSCRHSWGRCGREKACWSSSAVRDISERKEFESRILHQATTTP